jgi:uncharacterized protein (DUF2141 family)
MSRSAVAFGAVACRTSKVLAAVSALIFATSASANKDDARADASATLTVHLTELRNDNGRVAVALFDSKKAFPDQDKALRGQVVRSKAGKAMVKFSNLRPGVYAVAVLHDENSNDRMDFNFVGMPLEGYGFTNDAAVWLGPPSFSAAAVRVPAAASKVTVRVRYFSL